MANQRDRNSLPPYCWPTKTSIACKPYLGKGVKRKTYTLCGINNSLRVIWKHYEELLDRLKEPTGPRVGTLGWLLDIYMESDQFVISKKGKPKSQYYLSEQRKYASFIKAVSVDDRSDMTLGDTLLDDISSGTITAYSDFRQSGGAPVKGNREIAFISAAWNWALARDKVSKMNPCSHCEKYGESSRKHYVTDAEYNTWLDFLTDSGDHHMRGASELMYLCRMRKSEVLAAKREHVLPEGFNTIRMKGSRNAITSYSPRLLAALELFKLDEAGRFSEYLVTYKGKRHGPNAFSKMWERRMQSCVAKHGIRYFTRHDLKRKGASDSDEAATVSTGNTPAMNNTYDVSILRAKATK